MRMYSLFFPGALRPDLSGFEPASAAEVQRVLMEHSDDPEGAARHLRGSESVVSIKDHQRAG